VSGTAVIFLDRDGVLNELVRDPVSAAPESPLEVADVRLVGGAAAVGRLELAGYALVCVSNQPAAAKGKATVHSLLTVHARVIELLAGEGVHLAASRLCLHHPEGVVPGLTGLCSCRKPAPGMLLDLAVALQVDLSASWMVGDTDADVDAGRAVGCRTVLVDYPGSAHKRRGSTRPDRRATSLCDAVTKVLGAETPAVGDSGIVEMPREMARNAAKAV
jgi:D-glycero-D-manno-heptose 1,7-bisphosphate phosphatase